METVIAIGIVAVLLSTFLAVFGPATQNIRRSVNSKDAERLVGALEQWMNEYDQDLSIGTTKYATAFDRAYAAIVEQGNSESNLALIAYQYRAKPDKRRSSDGSFEPFAGDLETAAVNKDYVIRSIVRPLSEENAVLREDLAQLQGRAFYVDLKPLRKEGTPDSRQIRPTKFNETTGPDQLPGNQGTSPDTVVYLPYTASFYALPSTQPSYYSNAASQFIGDKVLVDEDERSTPALVKNLVVTR